MSTQQKDSYSGKIATILLRRKAIDQAGLQKALEEIASSGKRLDECLIEKKLATEVDITLAISEYLGMQPITLGHFTPDAQLLESLPKEVLRKHLAVPLAKTGRTLTVALGDPFNTGAVDELKALTGLDIVPVVTSEKDVKELIAKFVEQPSTDLEDVFKDALDGDDVEVGHEKKDDMSIDQMLESAEGAPVIRIVNSILIEALRRRASDIHLEPMEKTFRLRYRIDGDLFEVPSPPKNLQAAIISRVKIMSDMNIAERRIPQDGRFKIRALNKEVDLRVNLLPTVFGEKVVMRILDKSNLAPSLSALGLDQKSFDSLVYAIHQPHGIILVTGPTGSGKTTTLYSCLQDMNTIDVNIVTTEDPVEYQLPGINQVQMNEDVGLTFSSALRAILRQDPDIVMVGEIRDQETAAIAVKAALTGHLVLSTLHTNDASGAITRLRDMGIEAFLLASSIIMTQAQRLYKKLCQACKSPRDLPLEYFRLNGLNPKEFEGCQLFDAGGCPKCNNTGFKGRASIMEILMVDDDIRQLVLQNANASAIAKKAIENGMLTLRMVGLQRVRDGISTIEEILSVTGGGTD
ncbi:MAG: Flp pilus assembly complex ATPase component TadA [Lentisphaerae bacterium]|nr:Flp pilus assembly complex ATPase component TadA [Lentisphaerota bacterium]